MTKIQSLPITKKGEQEKKMTITLLKIKGNVQCNYFASFSLSAYKLVQNHVSVTAYSTIVT